MAVQSDYILRVVCRELEDFECLHRRLIARGGAGPFQHVHSHGEGQNRAAVVTRHARFGNAKNQWFRVRKPMIPACRDGSELRDQPNISSKLR
jgi:hypothetical protein